MRFSLPLVLLILFCIAPATATITCGSAACSFCDQNKGLVRIIVNDGMAISIANQQMTMDGSDLQGVLQDFVTIIYDTDYEYRGQAPPGYHSFRITATGYSAFSDTIQVCAGKETYVNVHLTKSVSLGKTGINTGAAKITTTTTTPSGSSGSSVKPGGAFGNVPLPTTTVPVAGSTTVAQAVAPANPGSAASTQQPDTLGSLSVKTEPAGAFIFIDGVQRGVTPATIPGIPAGTHTLLLKLDGYQDISTPVTIAAGKTQEYSSAMAKAAAPAEATAAVTAAIDTTVTPKKSPGFEGILALAVFCAALVMRRYR